MKILITSGGTKVNIDPVRHIGNMSSGTMGKNIALSALSKGHHVTFLTSKEGKTPFSVNLDLENMTLKEYDSALETLKKNHTLYRHNYEQFTYDTYDDYEKLLLGSLDWVWANYDAIVLCAAVSDYTVEYSKDKMKSADAMSIPLIPTKKLIPEVIKRKKNAKVIGFKLLNHVEFDVMKETCSNYIDKYGLDMIVGNDLWHLKHGHYYNLLMFADKSIGYIVSDFSNQIVESIESL
jgi:phosphopantothenoylcysteine synthetase/decarboxylase